MFNQWLECHRTLSNIALGAYTYNSSAHYINTTLMMTSFFTVDGKHGLNDNSVMCSLTVPGFEPHWIGVDLGNLFTVFYIVICAGSNYGFLAARNDLDYLIVGVSNRSLDVHPPVRGTYDLCAQYPGVVALKQVVQLNCSSTTPPARYVILQQPSNSTGYMSVCEFEVYGTPYGTHRENILYNKPGTSSSVYYELKTAHQCGAFSATPVVDGFHDTLFYNCHCGSTDDKSAGANWFMFDLQGTYYVDHIIFTARLDYYAGDHRLDNFYVGFSNQPSSVSPPIRNQYPLCGQWPGYVVPGSKVLMKCNANLPSFTYLIAQQALNAADGYFTICELEAYAPISRNFLVWKRKFGFYLSGYRVQTMSVRSATECFHQVRQVGGCDSINFNAATKTCELNKHQNGYNGLVSNASWAFYVVQYN
ncbi:hypothetical protein HELRODRAFT_175331 [Helobdella robusta]|uniref:Apple domain-containing protein n=1 Tax=Helobdella robusta TaxID=6412 RepID=T1F954_HELRO|nr:hypothetical protein HELRODRAFT_175331 [Helobdella robusta]ESO00838.1 hypothetical protein HELRODRAFT_175331 [Helobdella robusta]